MIGLIDERASARPLGDESLDPNADAGRLLHRNSLGHNVEREKIKRPVHDGHVDLIGSRRYLPAGQVFERHLHCALVIVFPREQYFASMTRWANSIV
jgi:hypothetical protein